jgi:hypothetical protein
MRLGRKGLRVRVLLQLVGGLALLTAACVITFSFSVHRTDAVTPAGGPIDVGSVPTSAAVHADGRKQGGPRKRTGRRPVLPRQVRIPKLGVRAPVLSVGVGAEGGLEVPGDPRQVGWWAGGAKPGAARGTAVIAGHINTAVSGPGAFAALDRLRPGDRIVVAGPERKRRFHVVALREYPKSRLPAKWVFSQRVPGRLALVSCAGPFNPETGHYRDNIIVYALSDSNGR